MVGPKLCRPGCLFGLVAAAALFACSANDDDGETARTRSATACQDLVIERLLYADAVATESCQNAGGGQACALIDALKDRAVDSQCTAAAERSRGPKSRAADFDAVRACTRGAKSACTTLSIAWDDDCQAKGIHLDVARACSSSAAVFADACAGPVPDERRGLETVEQGCARLVEQRSPRDTAEDGSNARLAMFPGRGG